MVPPQPDQDFGLLFQSRVAGTCGTARRSPTRHAQLIRTASFMRCRQGPRGWHLPAPDGSAPDGSAYHPDSLGTQTQGIALYRQVPIVTQKIISLGRMHHPDLSRWVLPSAAIGASVVGSVQVQTAAACVYWRPSPPPPVQKSPSDHIGCNRLGRRRLGRRVLRKLQHEAPAITL